MQWFKNQSKKRKVIIIAVTPLLFVCLCAGLAQMISPSPEPTPTPMATVMPIPPTDTLAPPTEMPSPTTAPIQPADTPMPTHTPIPPTATPIPPTPTSVPIGLNRLNPVPIGQSIVADNDIELTILELARNAWPKIHKANMFNEEPGEGMEYVIAVIKVGYLGNPDATKKVSSWDFRIVGDQGVIYKSAPVVLDDKLDAELFGGGTIEGELAFEVASDERGLILIYDSGLDTGAHYLSLEQ